jgi:hypothetical protein
MAQSLACAKPEKRKEEAMRRKRDRIVLMIAGYASCKIPGFFQRERWEGIALAACGTLEGGG